jgi:hypothetical protein
VDLAWRDTHIFRRARGAVVAAKRQPHGEHIEPQKTGDRIRPLRKEHSRYNCVHSDDGGEHQPECSKAQAAVRTQHRVHNELAVQVRRLGGAFPTRLHQV